MNYNVSAHVKYIIHELLGFSLGVDSNDLRLLEIGNIVQYDYIKKGVHEYVPDSGGFCKVIKVTYGVLDSPYVQVKILPQDTMSDEEFEELYADRK